MIIISKYYKHLIFRGRTRNIPKRRLQRRRKPSRQKTASKQRPTLKNVPSLGSMQIQENLTKTTNRRDLLLVKFFIN